MFHLPVLTALQLDREVVMVKNGEHLYGEFGREIGKSHHFLAIAQVL